MLPACGTPARRSQIRTAILTRVRARQQFLAAGMHAGRMRTWWMAPIVPVESSGLIACVFSAALLEAMVCAFQEGCLSECPCQNQMAKM